MGPKPIIPIDHAINWYYGNYLMNPNNALRDQEGYDERVSKLLDSLREELAGEKMTHGQFIDLMKERGIHSEFYLYQKPKPTDCSLCRILGIK